MAKLENKQVNPILALVANWLVLGILGYILIGQTSKAIKVLITTILASCLCLIPGIIVGICSLVDVFQVATAVAQGEEVDEHEYKVELLDKFCKIIDKSAVFKG